MKIFKYHVPMAGQSEILMPKGAEPLSVAMQHGEPQVWALVDPTEGLTQHRFYLRGTGHDMGVAQGMRFVGTFQIDGALVFHLFDGGEV